MKEEGEGKLVLGYKDHCTWNGPTPTLKMLLVKTLGYAFRDYMVFEAAGLQSSLKILEEVTWNTDEHQGG
ncbi:unnamed protein product [Sphagnum jensenii]|uniref:Uncharacterized protein n=1 Tax=Sphagnum jensenii TaxID=128206 RepID=A0ABP1B493_9BRYO